MPETISLRDANQGFARLVREVESGREFLITRNGEPVARLSPVRRERKLTPEQEEALARTVERMRKGWPLGIDKFDRDEAHER
jgi:prevent-host-death family protein